MSVYDADFDVMLRVADRIADEPAAQPAPRPDRAVPNPAIRQRWNLPGILGDTRISTNFGEVPAHLIRERDRLRTRDHGFLPVLRIEEYKLDEEFLMHRPDAKPVTLARGCLKAGLPRDNVYLSPAQRVQRMTTGVANNAVEARELSKQHFAFDRSLGRLSYFIFHLGQPALIRTEGIWINVDLA